MKLTFLGAAQTVTGTCYLVQTEKTAFLIDCGLHQGLPDEVALNELPFPFKIADIDFMLLSHAHIDHSGRIPKLYVDGFRQPIYATRPTAELCGIMLPDSGHIQEQEYSRNQRKNKRAGRPARAPRYTLQDGVDACRLFRPVVYDQPIQPADDVRVVFRDAGHILGSSILEIWIRENNHETKLVFSGDLGNKGIPIMRDPTIIDGADYLILESTYGDRLHSTDDKIERFVSIMEETIRGGGNVIIPSFAVGRTQELIYELNRESERYREHRLALQDTPVYVDSPLAISATEIFRRNPDFFDEEARQYIANGDNPLDFTNLHFVTTPEESRLLNISPESKVIIASSGMCDAGRIQHHLKHNLWRPECAVIFVGYQAEGTLGRQLVDGARSVRIFGEEIAVRARIEMLDGFSGHADRDGLLAWLGSMQHRPEQVFLVHGEAEVLLRFQASIREHFKLEAQIARLDETVSLGKPVQQPGLALVRHRDRAVTEAVWQLDQLQDELAGLLARLKEEIRTACTHETMEPLLHDIEAKLQQSQAILDKTKLIANH